MSPNAQTKTALRRQMQTARRALSAEEHQAKSAAICARAEALPQYTAARKMAAYYPAGTEVDCRPIFAHALAHQKKIYLPIVIPGTRKKALRFGPYLPDTYPDLQKASIGILEPPFDPATALTARNLRLVFVPLMGFDALGHRLGTGAGYYDLSFQWLKEKRLEGKASCVLVGLAFDCQEVSELPQDPWDVPMDYILTESRTIECL